MVKVIRLSMYWRVIPEREPTRKPQAGDVELTKTEIRDILALNQKYERFVLVLNVGGMVNLEPVNAVGTVLLLGQLGSATEMHLQMCCLDGRILPES